MTSRKVRVRFAPSPTGPLHIGGVRTALFNYLFARKNNGDFILRIEDTDQSRFVPGAEEYIINSLEWCNIQFDEGVTKGGKFGPYRQSERKNIYREYVDFLLKEGYAYYAFDTSEELENKRKEMESAGKNFTYDISVRNIMKNSLSLGGEKVKLMLDSDIPYAVRFKMPENELITFNDIVRQEVKVNTSTLDDKILFKSDGIPTYHLANVVDDFLMQISHVIRGEEWLPSTPLHVLLYKCFGWEDKMPEFAHMPLTLKPDGKRKLSKRDGDRLGFPVFPLEWVDPKTKEIYKGFRESGYLPEAFINILVFLGWNPGTTKEIFSLDELVNEFSLEKIGKAGSRFDPEKAKWFNHQYISAKSEKELVSLFIPVLKEKGITVDPGYIAKVCGLIRERINFIHDFWDKAWYFFVAPTSYNEKTIRKKWKEDTPGLLSEVEDLLTGIETFDKSSIEKIIRDYLESKDLGFGVIMNALRLSIVGSDTGAGMFDIMEIIGKEETLKRIEAGLRNIKL